MLDNSPPVSTLLLRAANYPLQGERTVDSALSYVLIGPRKRPSNPCVIDGR